MSEMQFVEDVNELEHMFEQHKVDHRDIMDFRHQVDQCIARQVRRFDESQWEKWFRSFVTFLRIMIVF